MTARLSVKTFFCAISLVLGEFTGFSLGRFSREWETLASAGFLAFAYFWGKGAKHLFLPAVFFTGIVLAARCEDIRRKTLFMLEGGYRPPTAISLKIESAVSERVRNAGGKSITFDSSIENVPLKVSVPMGGRTIVPSRGEVWKCRGWISAKKSSRPFERRRFWIGSKNEFSRIAGSSHSDPSNFFGKINENLSKLCDIGLERYPETANLNKAILLGNKSLMTKEMRENFANAGTIHVFAISGLHIMLVAGILNTALARLGFSEKTKTFMEIPLLVAFVVLTGSKPSAVRALVMAILMLAAPLFSRKSSPLSAWSLAALFIYGIKPEMLFDVGCTFSFAVMLGITAILEAKMALDKAKLSKESVKNAEERSQKHPLARFLMPDATSLAVSLAAWVMSVPVSCMFFGRISFGGLLANLAVMKFAGLSVRFGFYALCAAAVCTPLIPVLNNCCAFCTWCMVAISEATASIPFSSMSVRPWSPVECALWYAVWFLAFKAFLALGIAKISGNKKWW
jgi:ComEC/Rec2-related protein